jgi:hypothetical protein
MVTTPRRSRDQPRISALEIERRRDADRREARRQPAGDAPQIRGPNAMRKPNISMSQASG